MAWSSQGPRVLKFVGSLTVGVSAVAYAAIKLPSTEVPAREEGVQRLPNRPKLLNEVLASWTSNFSPSVEWDHNWDR